MIGLIKKQANEYFQKAEKLNDVCFELRILQCAIRFPEDEEFKNAAKKINNNEKIN